MTEYRAYILDSGGGIIGFEPMICADDAHAVERAKRLVVAHGIELWSGPRLVIRLESATQDTMSGTEHNREG
jgi:hypothetical protein